MSQFFYIHPENPQARLINQAVEILRNGGVIVYPTDSGYALGCMIGDKHAMDRIVQIRQLPEGHNFTLVCSDLSELSNYSLVTNSAYRLIKNNTPGRYTFILTATKELPHITQSDPEEIRDRLERQVDLIIHGGYLGQEPTTVVDLTESTPVILREGSGAITPFI